MSLELPSASGVCEPGAVVQENGSVRWSVWAPRAEAVELVLIEGRRQQSMRMRAEDEGWHQHHGHGVGEGTNYFYRLDGGPLLPDPASRWQPQGVHRPSAVFSPAHFAWTDREWRGVRREDLVIYELHVGTFTTRGTFEAVIPRLKALRELGVTALELMPVAQFPGARNWGYDGVHPFAVQNTYGGPRGLQQLVDACHQLNLAVILDVVYNHLGPEGNYFAEFGPYFTQDHKTPWGGAVNFDGEGSEMVRAFVLENVRYWLREFHIDGLRLDAVHAMHDTSPKHILQEIQETADEEARLADRAIHIFAESNLNDSRLLRSPEEGGYGVAAQWCDDFHHSLHALLTGERDGYYADYGRPEQLCKALTSGFVYEGEWSEFRGAPYGSPLGDAAADRLVVSLQTHDQVGNRARGDRLASRLSPAQQRLAAGVVLLSPYVPLLFMGEEYGEKAPFPFFCSFDDPELIEAVRRGRREEIAAFRWRGELPDPQDEATFEAARLSFTWRSETARVELRTWYHDLLHARRILPALRRSRRAARWHGAEREGILEYTRGCVKSDDACLVVLFNFSSRARVWNPLEQDWPGRVSWQGMLSSELRRYGGQRGVDSARNIAPTAQSWQLFPFEVLALSPRRRNNHGDSHLAGSDP